MRAYSTGYPCPAVVEITLAEDPWGSPRLYAGIGEDRGRVQELPPGGRVRATAGDPDAGGVVICDLRGDEPEVPAEQEVDLPAVRVVLASHLASGGRIPPDQAEPRFVGA